MRRLMAIRAAEGPLLVRGYSTAGGRRVQSHFRNRGFISIAKRNVMRVNTPLSARAMVNMYGRQFQGKAYQIGSR